MHIELENNFRDVEAVNAGVRGRLGLGVSSAQTARHMLQRMATRLGIAKANCKLIWRRTGRDAGSWPVDGPPRG